MWISAPIFRTTGERVVNQLQEKKRRKRKALNYLNYSFISLYRGKKICM